MFKTLSKMLFPEGIKCIICETELDPTQGGSICAHCKLKQNANFCQKCGRATAGKAKFCLECQTFSTNFDLARAPFVYDGAVKDLIRGFKFGNKRYLAAYLAEFMAKTCVDSEITADFITFVPLHHRKLKERGYNQAELLAKETGRFLDIPVVGVFDKVKDIKNTARLRKYQRQELIRDSIEVIPGVGFAGKIILLIDDVFTTGTTAKECSGKLLAAGADGVRVLTFATSKELPNIR